MLRQIRNGVFETNSSSTHTLSIYKKDLWEKFENGDEISGPFLDFWGDEELYTREELRKKYEEQCKEDNIEPSDGNFSIWLREEVEDGEFDTYDSLSEEYEILRKDIPDSEYTAISIYGQD